MSRRMRRPETAKLDISQGDWLLVKKWLTAGETRRMYGRMIDRAGDKPVLDPVSVGVNRCIAYLLDWSIEDADGKPVVIRDQPEDVVASALDALDAESFAEIQKAVEAHEAAMTTEAEALKNAPDGGNTSPAISPSAA